MSQFVAIILASCLSLGPMKQEFHLAPMQCYTHQPTRKLYHLLSPSSIKWTEMEKLDDIFPRSESIDYLHHSLEKRLGSPQSYDETNLVLQLGSNDPHRLKTCVEHAVQRYSFREINLNCGCPAIESGGAATYGASLMKRPDLTANLVDSVKRGLESVSSSDRPKVSVKCRIGVFVNAEQMRPLGTEDFDKLHRYITIIKEAGGNHVVLHARPAILSGLSPVRNRIVPPLDYEFVQNIAREFEGKIDITLNGGISTLTQIKTLQSDESSNVSSLMSGRWCLRRPLDLVNIEGLLTDQSVPPTENMNTIKTALEDYIDYALTMATLPQTQRRFTTSELCLPLYMTVEQLKDDGDYYEEDNQSADHPSLSHDEIESLFGVIQRGVIELEECCNKGNKKVQKSNVYKYLSSSFKSLAGKKVVGKWKRNRAEL